MSFPTNKCACCGKDINPGSGAGGIPCCLECYKGTALLNWMKENHIEFTEEQINVDS